MATITLKGDNVYSNITIADQKMPYKGSRQGQYYYIITIGDRNGTCSEEFRDLHKAGKVDSVSYAETDYQPLGPDGQPRIDPVTNAAFPKRKSLALGGYLTKDQRLAIMRGDKELIKAEAELTATAKVAGKIAERQAYMEADIPQAEMLELMKLA